MLIELIESFFLGCRPTFKKIIQAKSVQEYKPDPYVVTVLNCALWSFYGMPFVTEDDILVLTINGAGLVLELAYVTIYVIYTNWATRVSHNRSVSANYMYFRLVKKFNVVCFECLYCCRKRYLSFFR